MFLRNDSSNCKDRLLCIRRLCLEFVINPVNLISMGSRLNVGGRGRVKVQKAEYKFAKIQAVVSLMLICAMYHNGGQTSGKECISGEYLR